jgi:hypothetical protein
MPRKGNYTQALAILLRGALPSQEIEERLGEFKIARRAKADEPGGPSTLVAYRPDVNGYVLIDVVDGPPRRVIRWFPQDHRTPPAELTDT